MPKKYLVFMIIIGIVISACQRINVLMKDGYYTAEIAEFDECGWKEYITICVSGGKIISVEYNACNRSGFLKSWDMDYMRSMIALNGTCPNEYTRAYAGGLLRKQGVEGIDGISGATVSYRSFIRLAEAAIENAKMGRTAVAFVQPAEAGRDDSAPSSLY
jgi:major membrane immunogen (membrane-anchored lipoprotein)